MEARMARTEGHHSIQRLSRPGSSFTGSQMPYSLGLVMFAANALEREIISELIRKHRSKGVELLCELPALTRKKACDDPSSLLIIFVQHRIKGGGFRKSADARVVLHSFYLPCDELSFPAISTESGPSVGVTNDDRPQLVNRLGQ